MILTFDTNSKLFSFALKMETVSGNTDKRGHVIISTNAVYRTFILFPHGINWSSYFKITWPYDFRPIYIIII